MRRVLVFGATSAIAMACAREWIARDDAPPQFFLVARNRERLAQVAADLQVRGAQVQTFVLDATDRARHGAMIEAAVAGLGRIDVALVAHGTAPDQAACEADADLAVRHFEANGTSVIALLLRLAAVVEAQRHGCIAVITSVAGDRGRPSNYVYGSAKAAVQAFCEGLRARLFRSGAHVIDIRPGFVATPLTRGLPLPARLVASPETVARRIVRGIDAKADVLYAPAFWAGIMLGVRSLPRAVFKRMRM